MKNKMAADRKQKSRLVFVRLFEKRLHYKVKKQLMTKHKPIDKPMKGLGETCPFHRVTNPRRVDNAPVICIPGSLGAGDSGDIAGPKCRDLTFDESRQCRRCAGVLISRQNNILCHIFTTRGKLSMYICSVISSCFVALMSMPVGIVNMVAKPRTKVYSLSDSCVH